MRRPWNPVAIAIPHPEGVLYLRIYFLSAEDSVKRLSA